MTYTITAKLEGADELKAKLEALHNKARGAVIEDATRKGAEVIRDAARANAPGPYIEMEITASTPNAAEYAIGPDRAHWYYQFFETGAGVHLISPRKLKAVAFQGAGGETVRATVVHPGIKAKPFLRPALDGQGGKAEAVMGRYLKGEIESVASG